MYEINWLAILGVAIANMVIGMMWYHPKVLGTAWMNAAGLKRENMDAGKGKMITSMVLAFISSIIMAYVLIHFMIPWGVFDVIGAIELAFWVWLGFVATTQIGVVLWEMKPWKLFFLNTAYSLLSYIVSAIILISFM